MDSRLAFAAITLLMVAAALGFVLPALGRRKLPSAGPAEGDSPSPATEASGAAPSWTRAAVALGLPAAAFALYASLGDFAALSDARAGLSAQLRSGPADAEPADDAAYAELERHLRRQPGDARALVLKARLDMQAQHFELAAAGYQKALAGNSKATRDPAVWLEYAEATGMAQGGTLAGPPQPLIDKALSLDPDHPKGLDLAGSAAWERGDFTAAVTHWTRLLAQIPPGSARHRELTAAIGQAGQRARLSLPAPR